MYSYPQLYILLVFLTGYIMYFEVWIAQKCAFIISKTRQLKRPSCRLI